MTYLYIYFLQCAKVHECMCFYQNNNNNNKSIEKIVQFNNANRMFRLLFLKNLRQRILGASIDSFL